MIAYHLSSHHFNYAVLMQDHLSTFFYSLIGLMFILFYYIKDGFARIGIFVMVIGMGIYIRRIDWIGLPCIMLLASFIYYGQNAVTRSIRGIAFLLAIIAGIYCLLYPIPGIANWQIVKSLSFSHHAVPFSMSLSIQAFLVGLFFLWFSSSSLMNEGAWKPVLKLSLLPLCLCIPAVMGGALYFQYVGIDIKPTNFFFLWAFHNLLFVCLAEEVIFRGMIQHFLMLQFQNVSGGKWLALMLASALFGLFHFQGGWLYMLLAGIFGLFIGYAYIRTKKIEASIFVHFSVNAIHFLAFTYPALRVTT